MEVSLRDRLGGRRAISWQAVVIGDVLIVMLATALAAAQAPSGRALDAATDLFAITMATAVVAATYTGTVHRTAFRNRSKSPIPVPIAIGFHLSIGVIFLIGFAVGARVLGIPPLGTSATFVIGVLSGGLLVCIPTSLLLDHSDRYRAARRTLIQELAELERLRISEWSLRQGLRSLSAHIDEESITREIQERLDALDLSDDIQLSTEQLWQTSLRHHQGESTDTGARPPQLSEAIHEQLAHRFPPITWAGEWRHAAAHLHRFPVTSALASAFLVWLFTTWFAPSAVSISIGVAVALGIFVIVRFGARRKLQLTLLAGVAWISLVVVAGNLVLWVPSGATVADVAGFVIAAIAAVAVSCLVAGWVGAVLGARDEQQELLVSQIRQRREESAAVFASLVTIITKMTESPSLSGSAAMAACATGLQRAQRETDPVNARRIIDWTESVIAAPGVLTEPSVQGRIEDVVHPWRALADISVHCEPESMSSSLAEDIVAVVDEAVRNACRHGDARVITVEVAQDAESRVLIEVLDDGVGVQDFTEGLGLELFRRVGTAGFEISDRHPGPGTRVSVVIGDRASIGA